MIPALVVAVIILASFSGIFLKYTRGFNVSLGNQNVPIIGAILGILACTQLRNFSEALIFFLAAIFQFTAYVFVSRLRQRGSFFWHSMAAIASNGMWYVTLHILNQADTYWMLFVPYTLGIITGRIIGVNWAQFVEQKYELKADATRDSRLEPGKRINYIKQEPMFWFLIVSLALYIVHGFLALSPEKFLSILIVVGLGILQNFFYALTTRAVQRGHNWYIVTTGMAGGLTFYLSVAYLFSKEMDWVLIVPYILATTLGSTLGAFMSMIIEWTMKLRPDDHLETARDKKSGWSTHAPYVVILILSAIWVLGHENLFNYLGVDLAMLRFPVSAITTELPRGFIMLSAAIIFLLDTALHTVSSRAGNRNHTGYHVTSLVPKGFVDFFKVSYLSLNSSIPDVIPVAILASCLGSLFGKDIAEKLEKWLQARMDIEPEKPKPKSVTV